MAITPYRGESPPVNLNPDEQRMLAAKHPYDQQAFLATAVMQKSMVLNKDYLKQNLPRVHTVIEIGFKSSAKQGEMNRVMSLNLDYSNGQTIKMNLAVHQLATLDPELQGMIEAAPPQAGQNCQAMVLQGEQGSITLCAPQQIDVITKERLQQYRTPSSLSISKAAQKSPDALKTLEVLKEIFPNGFSLPGGERIEAFHFHVMSYNPKGTPWGGDCHYQEILSEYSRHLEHIFGQSSHHTGLHATFDRVINPSASGQIIGGEGYYFTHEMYEAQFNHMVDAAKGLILPRSLIDAAPQDTKKKQILSTATFQGQIPGDKGFKKLTDS